MVGAEFEAIARRLKASYASSHFLDTQLHVETWFNMLMAYDARDVESAVFQYIEENNRPPVPNDIILRVKDIVKAKEKKTKFDYFSGVPLVRCRYCNDTGYRGIKMMPNGSEYLDVCDCKAAKDNFPWLLMTQEEKNQWYEDEERHGRHPERGWFETRKVDWDAINKELHIPCEYYLAEEERKKKRQEKLNAQNRV